MDAIFRGMLALNTTVVLLRVTAFCSVLCFTAAYAFSLRKYWLLFVFSHSIHLGFIFWYAVGLHQPVSTFTLWSGIVAYSVIFVMAGFDVHKPGSALENLWGLWFIGLNLFGTFPVMIYGHWGEQIRIHSWLGMALMVAGLILRHKKGIAGKAVDRKTMLVRSLGFILLCIISFCLVAFLRSRSPSILSEMTEIESDYDTVGSLVLSPSVLAQSFPDVREIAVDPHWPRAGSRMTWKVGPTHMVFSAMVSDNRLPGEVVLDVVTPSAFSQITHRFLKEKDHFVIYEKRCSIRYRGYNQLLSPILDWAISRSLKEEVRLAKKAAERKS